MKLADEQNVHQDQILKRACKGKSCMLQQRTWISVSLRSCLRCTPAAEAAASLQRTTLVMVAEKRSFAASTAGEPCSCTVVIYAVRDCHTSTISVWPDETLAQALTGSRPASCR